MSVPCVTCSSTPHALSPVAAVLRAPVMPSATLINSRVGDGDFILRFDTWSVFRLVVLYTSLSRCKGPLLFLGLVEGCGRLDEKCKVPVRSQRDHLHYEINPTRTNYVMVSGPCSDATPSTCLPIASSS